MSLTSPHQKALFLSYLTVGYNLLEGALSLLAGCLAGSIALVAFGLDSFVESLSGGIMIWRFRGHADMTSAQAERREKLAIKMVGGDFLRPRGLCPGTNPCKNWPFRKPRPQAFWASSSPWPP